MEEGRDAKKWLWRLRVLGKARGDEEGARKGCRGGPGKAGGKVGRESYGRHSQRSRGHVMRVSSKIAASRSEKEPP